MAPGSRLYLHFQSRAIHKKRKFRAVPTNAVHDKTIVSAFELDLHVLNAPNRGEKRLLREEWESLFQDY